MCTYVYLCVFVYLHYLDMGIKHKNLGRCDTLGLIGCQMIDTFYTLYNQQVLLLNQSFRQHLIAHNRKSRQQLGSVRMVFPSSSKNWVRS